MKKLLLFCVLLFSVSGIVLAVEAPAAGTPLAQCKSGSYVSFITSPDCSLTVSGLRFSIFYGRAYDVTGVSIGIVNETSNDFVGAECGIVNTTKGSFSGVRSGFVNNSWNFTGVEQGFINTASNVTGIRSGFINITDYLLNGAEIGFVNTAGTVNGYRAGFVNLTNGDVSGVEAGFVNTRKNLNGASLGFVNITEGDITGMQAGFVNTGKKLNGAMGGFVNLIDGDVRGYQGGFVNGAKSITGIQTGFVNVSDRLKGVQTGFVNICGDLEGVNLGVINILGGGFGKISVFSSVETLYNLAFKSGKEFYGIIGAGYDHREAKYADKYTISTGLGYHGEIGAFFIDFEALSSAVSTNLNASFDWKTDLKQCSEVRLLPGVKIGESFEIFAGPSVKYYSEGDITKREAWNWSEDKLKISAVAGVNVRVF